MRHPLIVAVLLLLAFAGRAEAACTISTTPVNFGSYNVFNTSATPANGTITYRCGAADHNITISISTGSSGSFANRTMKKSTENLTYNLYWTRRSRRCGAMDRARPGSTRSRTRRTARTSP